MRTSNPFWNALAEVPALRFQLIEISHAKSRDELVLELCFDNNSDLSGYLHGPLSKRARRVGGEGALAFLRSELGRLGV